jgi:Tfp pilus assembly protein PilW
MGKIRACGPPAELIRQASATVVYRLEIAAAPDGILRQLGQLPGVDSVEAVSQTSAVTVLELTFRDPATPPVLWQTLAAHNIAVKRYAPKDDGLRTLIRNGSSVLAEPNPDTVEV